MCYNIYNKYMNKPRILSGIQPSGKLHIGNYLGALKNFVELQDSGKYECYFFIADYHSITENYNPKEKPQQILDLMLDFLATGLDPNKSIMFLQSQIGQHTELAWIFNTITPVSELERMTQYKDKSRRQEKNVNAGLFTYPALMAADILIYKPAIVPVGDDQTQHLEITRKIVRKFNNKFGQTFKEPKPLLTKSPRVMSLTDPARKMAKSEAAGCLFITDEPKEIEKKIKRAVTDTSPDNKSMSPGVANLFSILESFGTKNDIQKFSADHKSGNIKYSELKVVVAERITNHFADFRSRRKEFGKHPEKIKKIISEGNKRAQIIANKTLIEIKQKMGLVL